MGEIVLYTFDWMSNTIFFFWVLKEFKIHKDNNVMEQGHWSIAKEKEVTLVQAGYWTVAMVNGLVDLEKVKLLVEEERFLLVARLHFHKHPQKAPLKLGGANPTLPDQLIPHEELHSTIFDRDKVDDSFN